MTSEVNRSNTLDDIGDNELFKSSLEPSADNIERMNGASFSSVPAHLEPTENISLFKGCSLPDLFFKCDMLALALLRIENFVLPSLP